MWKIKKTGMLLLLVVFSLLSIAGSVSAATLYVDDNGAGPYKTIQSAVNAAKEGDTIIVNPGTYKETVNMTVSDLTFQGKSYPSVYGFKNWQNPDIGDGDFGTESETINGFNLVKDGIAIYGRHSYDNLIRNNYFYSCGVTIEGYESGSSDIIMNNEFHDKGISIGYLNGGYCKITGNRIYNSHNGIYLRGIGNICQEISGNIISGCNVGLETLGPEISVNLIYNNLFNNTVNVKLDGEHKIGNWNMDPPRKTINIVGGPYVCGNYWASPNGDGFSQTRTDSNGDGIIEYAYAVDSDNLDYYPLAYPVKVPNADFSASTTSGNAPLTVKFTDSSTGSPTSWKWSFGDGSALVTQYNPTYTYTKSGTYTVKETVSNAAGKDTEIKTNYITVKAAPVKSPVAAFSASPTSGKKPLKVQFTDKSTNNPTSWKWSFGDGTYSTSKNPAHTYSKAGKYTVSLTTKNSAGSNTKLISGYITVK